MMLFQTERLLVKSLENKDRDLFVELFSDPKIINAIPQPEIPKEQLMKRFFRNLDFNGSIAERQKYDCGIFIKGKPEMIGLCLFLTNDEGDRELGYRFRVKFWGKGYGTEVTEAIIAYCFNILNVDKVTADADVENAGSIKILSKFMKPAREFFNERDGCTDRRYSISRTQWIEQKKRRIISS